MSNREQALRDHLVSKWRKTRNCLCADELEAALALPADAAEPRKESHGNDYSGSFVGASNMVDSRERVVASPSAVLTEEQITTIIKIFYSGFTPPDPIRLENLHKALRLLSAPAQPKDVDGEVPFGGPPAAKEVRRDRIDNVTRDTPGEGKL